ncbi:hypothetical protein [Streptomyces griseus]
MQGVLKKLSDDPDTALVTVRTLGMILDPSLPEKSLAASLAKLAAHAKGAYKTVLLPVGPDGRVSASDTVVRTVLGGTAKAPEQGAAVRVAVLNATGKAAAVDAARIALVNGDADGGVQFDVVLEERRRPPQRRQRRPGPVRWLPSPAARPHRTPRSPSSSGGTATFELPR